MPSSKATFDEVIAVFQGALDAPGEFRFECASHGAAMNLRGRLNRWRMWDRETSVEMYKVGHPLYGRCIYDCLSTRVPPKGAPDDAWLYITKRKPLDQAGQVLGPDGVWRSVQGAPVGVSAPEEPVTVRLERPDARPLALEDIAFDEPKADE